MELELTRTYFPNGTGVLRHSMQGIIYYTIELPWLDNRHKISCIPEGKYELEKRYSWKFGAHLNTSKAGTAGGTLLTIFGNISSQDIFKTIVLAVVGAAVSFAVPVLLKRFMRRIKK